ncbi:MAG: class I SAM-dependent methyltransferase [Hyphomicrobiaceae bacterium]
MYQGRLAELSISNVSLETRLDINQRFSSRNFHDWLLTRLAVKPGANILDVGSGNGAQSLAMLARVAPLGTVSAMDISAQSIARLRDAAGNTPALQTAVGDMQDLAKAISTEFHQKSFDLAQSTYALYYAARPLEVLDVMRGALNQGGRLAVCTPNDPHSLSLLCGRFLSLPPDVVACGRFGPDVLEPYFRRHFAVVDIHLLRNVMEFTDSEDVLILMRNAAYFDPEIEVQVKAVVEAEISSTGLFRAEKNSYLIIGHTE